MENAEQPVSFPNECYECGLIQWLMPQPPKGYGITWPCLFFYKDETSSDAIQPSDQGGFIPTRKEWEELRNSIDIFYESPDAALIAHHNLELRKEYGLLPETPVPLKPTKPRILKPGHVYILAAENDRYKIGRAKTLENRLKSLRTASPLSFTLTHSIQSADTVSVESFLHRRFSDKRTHGEWFDLTPEDVAWVCALSDFQLDTEIAA